MGILTFIFWIIVLLVAIYAVVAASAIAIVVLMFAAIIKGIEQGYHAYMGEPFEVIWIIGGVIALIALPVFYALGRSSDT